MGKTLSMDLRERVVAAYERGQGGYEALSKVFGIGSATLKRLVRRKRERGTLEPDPAPNGFPPRISGPRLHALKLLVGAHPDATTAELTTMLNERISVSVSRSAVVRALQRLNITRKKSRSARPRSRDLTS